MLGKLNLQTVYLWISEEYKKFPSFSVSSLQGDTVINILIDVNGFLTYENRELLVLEDNEDVLWWEIVLKRVVGYVIIVVVGVGAILSGRPVIAGR